MSNDNFHLQALINAVLSEDVDTVRTLCAKGTGCNVNISFKVRRNNDVDVSHSGRVAIAVLATCSQNDAL